MRERMLEGVLDLRERGLFVNKLAKLKIRQDSFEFITT